ncbi:MAG: D-alanyl-D-alanine carboxypeptidase [Ruminococcus sp.]|nr:D-alanyl-D-alanine carboxypeptidase [Ruminococcus sp.]
MKKVLRFLSLFLVIGVLFSVFSVCASAVTFDNTVTVYSDSIFMVNLDTGMPVYERDPDAKRYPASLTKVMTYIVACEYFDDIENTRIEIKQSIIDQVLDMGMVTSGLEWHTGESLTVLDILYNLMIPVGHDSAMVLADYIGSGSVDAFVGMMNEKALALGCTGTHFTNPTGIHDDNHYTTARDMYLMTKYALGLPMFSKICATSTYYIEDDDYPIITTNYMIDPGRGGDYFYTYATGIKNGTTNEAGRCLVATAVYEGYAYLCVSLHAPYNENKDDLEQYCMLEAADLFRWAFLNLTFVTATTRTTPVCEQKVDHAWDTDSILLVPESDLNVVLPNDYAEGDIKIVPDNTESVSAPITAGDIITTATVYYKGQEFDKINLVAQDSVNVSPILYFTDAVRSVLTSVWFLLAVAVIVVLFIVYITVSASYSRRKKARERNERRRSERRNTR